MKVLVIGGGGREHALVWKLAQSREVEKIWCAPGNGGIAAEAECIAADVAEVRGLTALAERLGPGLTVVGPELPLVNGIGDAFRARRWPIVEPDAASAKDFIERVLEKGELGPGGQRILLEETLEGEELSFILISDGHRFAPLVPTRDHKRVFDGNLGPNTGGMGAYSSDELLPPKLRDAIIENIVAPTMYGLLTDGIRYQGFLYIGLMLTKSGPKVLEFNCRLGDPETQAIATRMDFDFAEVLADAAAGRLDPSKLRWKPGASVCVVLTSRGYPGKFEMGKRIEGLTAVRQVKGVEVLHAGTRREG